MIDILNVPTKDTRAFGWVQDSSSIDSLCNVVAVFDFESDFHKKLVNEIIPSIVLENDGRQEMIDSLTSKPLNLIYRLLIGTSLHLVLILVATVLFKQQSKDKNDHLLLTGQLIIL